MKGLLKDLHFDIPWSHQKNLMELAPHLDKMERFPHEAYRIIARNNHFHLFVPKRIGGLDFTLEQGMKVIEAYARIEGNFGWIVQIGAGGGVFSAYLDNAVSKRFFGKNTYVVAGSDYVGGRATPVQNGYSVTGKWRYASGSLHATAFTGNCRIMDGPNEGKVIAVIIPAEEIEVIKDWNAMGLRATDSHSFCADEVKVPLSHTFLVDPEYLLIKNRLLELPFLLYARALFTPVLTGIVAKYHLLLENYMDQRGYTSTATAKESCRDLANVLQISRQNLYGTVRNLWKIAGLHPLDNKTANDFAATCVGITSDLLLAVDKCHRHTGMEGIRMDTPLNVAYRNLKTAAAHFLLSPSSLLS